MNRNNNNFFSFLITCLSLLTVIEGKFLLEYTGATGTLKKITSEGSFLALRGKLGSPPIPDDYFIYKFHPNFTLHWNYEFFFDSFFPFQTVLDIEETTDGNYLVVGQFYSASPPRPFVGQFAKIDPNGNIIWSFSASNGDPQATIKIAIYNKIIKDEINGGFLLTGSFLYDAGTDDIRNVFHFFCFHIQANNKIEVTVLSKIYDNGTVARDEIYHMGFAANIDGTAQITNTGDELLFGGRCSTVADRDQRIVYFEVPLQDVSSVTTYLVIQTQPEYFPDGCVLNHFIHDLDDVDVDLLIYGTCSNGTEKVDGFLFLIDGDVLTWARKLTIFGKSPLEVTKLMRIPSEELTFLFLIAGTDYNGNGFIVFYDLESEVVVSGISNPTNGGVANILRIDRNMTTTIALETLYGNNFEEGYIIHFSNQSGGAFGLSDRLDFSNNFCGYSSIDPSTQIEVSNDQSSMFTLYVDAFPSVQHETFTDMTVIKDPPGDYSSAPLGDIGFVRKVSCHECNSIPFTSPLVCSGFHGIECLINDTCICLNSSYRGSYCEVFDCFRVSNMDEERVCSGHGKCVEINTCNCTSDNYTGLECRGWNCFGVEENDELTCTGHGNCTDYDQCSCFGDYYNVTEKCEWNCYGVFYSQKEDVCMGHGECIFHNNCSCDDSSYSGFQCEMWKCYNVSVLNSELVCSGHGQCIDVDRCICKLGYGSSTVESACDEWDCGKFNKDDPGVCSSRGICRSRHFCECTDTEFEGNNCDTWKCYGTDRNDGFVCSGHGECVKKNECKCSFGYGGKRCEIEQYLFSIVTPLLIVSSSGLLLICFSICLVFCCFICLTICGLLCIGICLILNSLNLKKRVKYFGKLHNFEVLLQEQKMEEDTSIAHLKINKDLFEVEYDEIKLEKVLGEGGSNSIVYKAKYAGSQVAFKCFKTRTVCGSQMEFDEFEKEVSILSSINHPYILQFLGASLKPPRIGILMEYCSNGDLNRFLNVSRKTNPSEGYPSLEKFRICKQIISSMSFLHSRSIIHRDLKLENILVDENENCKLMDFGLSKFVDRGLSQSLTKKIGTSIYMAPEIMTKTRYDEKVDVFSFGVMLFIIFTENFFPYGKDSLSIEFKVALDPQFRPDIKELDGIQKIAEKQQEWLKKMIVKCWQHEPEERLSFKELSKLFNRKFDEETPSQNSEDDEKIIEIEKNKKQEEEEEGESEGRKDNERIKELERLVDLLREEKEMFEVENEKLKNTIMEFQNVMEK